MKSGKKLRGPALCPDLYEHNADWTKRSWDFPESIQDAETFRRYLRSLGLPVADFKTLFVYRAKLGKIPWLKVSGTYTQSLHLEASCLQATASAQTKHGCSSTEFFYLKG